ncbi:MAG: rhodanese-like domain-containing protein [Desulfosoma sp.]
MVVDNRRFWVNPWSRALRQALGLMGVALVLAFVVNSFRSDSLPWLGDRVQPSADVQMGGLEISLEEAQLLYFTEQAVFLDARHPEAYQSGHIEKALNLPWMFFEEWTSRVLANIPKETPIITYCDEGCNLSRQLAAALMAQGYTQVRVLVNGWTEWLKNGLPVASQP